MQKAADIKTFKAIAYIVAEKGGVKWASNAAILVKEGGLLRMDAIENITDTVATISAGKNKGYLHLPLEDKWIPFENRLIKLPVIGEIPMTAPLLSAILIGRPPRVEGADIELAAGENLPASWTMFSYDSNGRKKGVLLETSFGDFITVSGRKFPQHVMIRFERPRLLMDIRYKEIWPNVNIPDALFEIGPKEN